MFADNPKVSFGDVNLQEQPIRSIGEHQYNPGAGGWPTIRYFNQSTGLGGGSYVKVTGEPMCAELGDVDRMVTYVEDYGNAFLCSVSAPDRSSGCDDRERAYTDKMRHLTAEEWTAQLSRLASMEGGSMKPDLAAWVTKRRKILVQLLSEAAAAAPKTEEL